MGIVERKAREKAQLRRQILDAATRLLVEEGFPNLSMRRIADAIEYSPATLYSYFPDKGSLVASICTDTFEQLNERLDAIRSQGHKPLETLRRSLREYIDFGLSHPHQYFVTFSIPAPQVAGMQGGACELILHTGMACFDRLRQGIAGCMQHHVIRNADVEETSQSVFLMLHGAVSMLSNDYGFPWVDREQLVQGTVERILLGLGADPTVYKTGS